MKGEEKGGRQEELEEEEEDDDETTTTTSTSTTTTTTLMMTTTTTVSAYGGRFPGARKRPGGVGRPRRAARRGPPGPPLGPPCAPLLWGGVVRGADAGAPVLSLRGGSIERGRRFCWKGGFRWRARGLGLSKK